MTDERPNSFTVGNRFFGYATLYTVGFALPLMAALAFIAAVGVDIPVPEQFADWLQRFASILFYVLLLTIWFVYIEAWYLGKSDVSHIPEDKDVSLIARLRRQ